MTLKGEEGGVRCCGDTDDDIDDGGDRVAVPEIQAKELSRDGGEYLRWVLSAGGGETGKIDNVGRCCGIAGRYEIGRTTSSKIPLRHRGVG